MPEDCDSSSQDPAASAEDPASSPSQWLTVEIVDDAGDWSGFGPVESLVEAAVIALARNPALSGHGQSEAVVALSDDANVRSLNATYRGMDKPTNVLSFPSGQGPRGGVISLGDIVLSAETLAREASDQSIPLPHHFQHLVVHGLLHLLGYDHETEAEAVEMEALETHILSTLNIENPYMEPAEPKA